MMSGKVLFISYDGLTDPLGQSQILPYLRALSRTGFELSLLTCEKPANFAQHREAISRLCQDYRIDWHPLAYTKSPPILSTVKDLNALRRTAFKLRQSHAFDIVHCRSYIPSLVGKSMRKKFGTKFVFDMRGFWADERIDGGLWRLKNPIHRRVYNFFKRREKEFLEQSDATVSLTEAAKQEMLTWNYNIEAEKIRVIPCCADFDHFNFETIDVNRTRALKTQLGINADATVFTYHGSAGTWYLVNEMLEFFGIVLKRYPKAHLLFVTNDNLAHVKARAMQIGLPSDKVTVTTAARAEIPELLSVTDISYFFIKPAYSKMSSCPTKLGEILGMGKPVICNTGVGDIDTIFASGELGHALDVNDRASWDRAIDSLDRLVELDPFKIRQRGLKLFGLQSGVDAYRSIYAKLSKPIEPLRSRDREPDEVIQPEVRH